MHIFEDSDIESPKSAESEPVRSDLVRLSVNMNQETADALRDVARSRGISYTEAVRRAISVYAFVEAEVAAGNTIQVRDPYRREISDLILLD